MGQIGGEGGRVVGLYDSYFSVFYSADGGLYEAARAFCFWNALLPLTNFARASMPAFVPRIVASLWYKAPSSIMCQCSLWVSHSNSICSRVWSSAPHGQSMGTCILCIWWYSPKYPCPVRACVTNPGLCLLSVRNAYDPCQRGWFAVCYGILSCHWFVCPHLRRRGPGGFQLTSLHVNG